MELESRLNIEIFSLQLVLKIRRGEIEEEKSLASECFLDSVIFY